LEDSCLDAIKYAEHSNLDSIQDDVKHDLERVFQCKHAPSFTTETEALDSLETNSKQAHPII